MRVGRGWGWAGLVVVFCRLGAAVVTLSMSDWGVGELVVGGDVRLSLSGSLSVERMNGLGVTDRCDAGRIGMGR